MTPTRWRPLALATDTKAYVDVQTGGLNEPARGPFPPSSPWYVPTTYPEYDKDAAKQLVQQVKASHGGEFTFRILGGTDATSLSGLQLLQAQWKEVGIDAQIATSEQAKLITDVALGNYQATAWRQFDSPHPLGDSIWWHPNTVKPIGELGLNFARTRTIASVRRSTRHARPRTSNARRSCTAKCSNTSRRTSRTSGCTTRRSAWSRRRIS